MTDILNKAIVLVQNRNWQAINIRTPAEAFCQMATNVATGLEIEFEDALAPSPSSMSSAVAAFVAIWQNASAGVRMLIACQLRLSTSTRFLFNMSFIKNYTLPPL